MSAKREDLLAAVTHLERVLKHPAGPPGAAHLEQALANLEDVVSRHTATLRDPNALMGSDMDRPRIPSPGVDRQTRHLREELKGLLQDVRNLRTRVPLPDSPGAWGDHANLARRARKLAEALERYEDHEVHLILDSVNTDIGSPD
jgi:hypothetical protein